MENQMTLPKVLFAKKENEGTEDEFLIAGTSDELAVPDETVEVGMYELKKYVLLNNSTTILDKTKPPERGP